MSKPDATKTYNEDCRGTSNKCLCSEGTEHKKSTPKEGRERQNLLYANEVLYVVHDPAS